MSAAALVVQELGGVNLFLLCQPTLPLGVAVELTRVFATTVKLLRDEDLRSPSGPRAVTPNFRLGTLNLSREYLCHYQLVGDLYAMVLVAAALDNPFSGQLALGRVKAVLLAACRGDVVSAAVINKRAGETYFALDRVMNGEDGCEVLNQKLLEIAPNFVAKPLATGATLVPGASAVVVGALERDPKAFRSTLNYENKRFDPLIKLAFEIPGLPPADTTTPDFDPAFLLVPATGAFGSGDSPAMERRRNSAAAAAAAAAAATGGGSPGSSPLANNGVGGAGAAGRPPTARPPAAGGAASPAPPAAAAAAATAAASASAAAAPATAPAATPTASASSDDLNSSSKSTGTGGGSAASSSSSSSKKKDPSSSSSKKEGGSSKDGKKSKDGSKSSSSAAKGTSGRGKSTVRPSASAAVTPGDSGDGDVASRGVAVTQQLQPDL